MRVLLAIALILFSAAAFADSSGERMQGDRAPTATELISGLYAFSRFQQGLLESTDLNKGNAEVKNLAALRAEEAARRDKALKQIQEAIGTEPRLSKAASVGTSLAEADSADGPAYVRSFYAAQIAEYESAIALFESYLKAPDNTALASFAREQLPMLRSQVRDDARAMSDK
jgi:tetratricopeptide (TPR) repeat protein